MVGLNAGDEEVSWLGLVDRGAFPIREESWISGF